MSELHDSGPINLNEEPTFGMQIPKLATDPASPQVGDIWLNTTSHAVKVETQAGTKTTMGTGTGVSKFAGNVGSGSTTVTITHNLGTLDVVAKLYTISTGVEIVPTSVTLTSTNVVTMVVGSSLGSNLGRAVVIG
jgi:hypothetical protein